MARDLGVYTVSPSDADKVTFYPMQTTIEEMMRKHHIVSVRGFLSDEECQSTVETLYSLRDIWKSDYDGEQFSFPQNYYAMYNAEKADEYLMDSSTANALVRDHLPLVVSRFWKVLGALTNDRVEVKEGWSGPGVVVFPYDEYVARNNGPIHIDAEGLAGGELGDKNAEVFSMICMLQKPTAGGGIRIWDLRYDPVAGEDKVLEEAQEKYEMGITHIYEVGEMVLIDSLCPHRILKFEGNADRITLNCFAVKSEGRWNIWF